MNQSNYKRVSARIDFFSGLFILLFTFFPYAIIPFPTIQSAAEPDYPPLSFQNKQGDDNGMAVELLNEIAQSISHKTHYEVRPWNKKKQALADDQLDVLPLVARNPEREKLFDFTVPYLSLYGAIVVHKENNTVFDTSDLHGLKIGVTKGNSAEEYIRRHGFSDSLITTQSYAETLNLLNQG